MIRNVYLSFRAAVKSKKSYVATLLFQVSLIGSQALLILHFYRSFSPKEFDELFLATAYLTPFYTFFLLGGKQLLLSGKLDEAGFRLMRFITLLCLLASSCAIYLTIPEWSGSIFLAATAWKVFEFYSQGIAGIFQRREQYLSLNALSSLRIAVFTVPLFLTRPQSDVYLAIAVLAVPCIAQLVDAFGAKSGLKNPGIRVWKSSIWLGSIALMSSLIISIPRIFLGEADHVSTGVLSFLSVFSYIYLFGQIFVNSVIPPSIVRLSRVADRAELVGQIRRIACYLTAFFVAIFCIIYAVLIAVLPYVPSMRNYSHLIPWALALIPVGLFSNIIEPFSSLLEKERGILLSIGVSLLTVVVSSAFLAGKFNGVGYCIALLLAFCARAACSGILLLAQQSKLIAARP